MTQEQWTAVEHYLTDLLVPADPSLDAALQAKISVSMCGEMAGDPIYTSLLVGMGLTELSVSPPSIPEIKKVIRVDNLVRCKEIAQQVSQMNETGAITDYLKSRLNEIMPGGEKFGMG